MFATSAAGIIIASLLAPQTAQAYPLAPMLAHEHLAQRIEMMVDGTSATKLSKDVALKLHGVKASHLYLQNNSQQMFEVISGDGVTAHVDPGYSYPINVTEYGRFTLKTHAGSYSCELGSNKRQLFCAMQ